MPNYLPYSERAPEHRLPGHAGGDPRRWRRVCRPSRARRRSRWPVTACAFRWPTARRSSPSARSRVSSSKAIGELCAFINGARTLEELAAFGCDWWDAWATPEKCEARGLEPGDLGPGSYGHAFKNFTTDLDGDDPGFDQLPHLIKKLKDLPLDRTALMSPWIPNANHREAGIRSRNTIAPCHGWIHALVFGEELHLIHNQRSGDTPIGVPSNMAQYTALGLMLEQLTGYQFVEYVHWIQYAHIYVNQLPAVEEMLAREPRRAADPAP